MKLPEFFFLLVTERLCVWAQPGYNFASCINPGGITTLSDRIAGFLTPWGILSISLRPWYPKLSQHSTEQLYLSSRFLPFRRDNRESNKAQKAEGKAVTTIQNSNTVASQQILQSIHGSQGFRNSPPLPWCLHHADAPRSQALPPRH